MQQYPLGFEPNSEKKIQLLDGDEVKIPAVRITFDKWTGQQIEHRYGDKPIVEYCGQGMFAELAIRSKIIDAGWSAQWIAGQYYLEKWHDATFNQQIRKPLHRLPNFDLLSKIDAQCCSLFSEHKAGSYDGCWDVIAWKGKRTLFIESKWKDDITEPQKRWLASAISLDLPPDKPRSFDFLIARWDFRA